MVTMTLFSRSHFLYPIYLLNLLAEFHQTCMKLSLRQAKELIIFGDLDLIFEVTFLVPTIGLEPMRGIFSKGA